MALLIDRPAQDEYPPYAMPYITRVPDGDVIDILERDLDALLRAIANVPEERGTFRYAPGKWSIKEVLGHIIDCERIYTYRALRFARGDQTPLLGFDENAYAPASGADQRQLSVLTDELTQVRRATVAFWRSLQPDVTVRRGVANGVEFSVRAIAYVTAGHGEHHTQMLRERYGIDG